MKLKEDYYQTKPTIGVCRFAHKFLEGCLKGRGHTVEDYVC